ncbi:MAG: PrsW family intramembrane metalloprotease [Clostridia bacterium]|nr:PrsW family intramembrane metalloprotease [Clostridia bacterium]
MNINTILLVAAALLPAVILCNYIYKKDRVEKEPMGLLVKLLLAGAFSCFPAAAVEGTIGGIIDGFFGGVYAEGVLYRLITYFIGVALVEEGFKWWFLVRITKDNKEFNCMFDGMIYAIFVSLGFAALENVLYVIEYGWINAIMRGVLSVPGHMFFAVMMGYYYSRWKIFETAEKIENEALRAGYIIQKRGDSFNPEHEKVLSILVPVIFHGTYNYCCSSESWLATIAFYVFVIFMYIYCFAKIKEVSRNDASTEKTAMALVAKKYPEIEETLMWRADFV